LCQEEIGMKIKITDTCGNLIQIVALDRQQR